MSRIAHYLKVIQRENIGSTKNKVVLQNELNAWIKSLVTEMNDPGPDLISTHPLKAAEVSVNEIEDNPGFFRVTSFGHASFPDRGNRHQPVARVPDAERKIAKNADL